MVRDASEAVLPGVTVEASSPSLIEKVRTAVTDGSGQYAMDMYDAATGQRLWSFDAERARPAPAIAFSTNSAAFVASMS